MHSQCFPFFPSLALPVLSNIMKKYIPILFVLSLGLCLSGSAAAQSGANPAGSQYTPANLLARAPLLKNIDYDSPAPEEIANCTVSASSEGYVVKDPGGRT